MKGVSVEWLSHTVNVLLRTEPKEGGINHRGWEPLAACKSFADLRQHAVAAENLYNGVYAIVSLSPVYGLAVVEWIPNEGPYWKQGAKLLEKVRSGVLSFRVAAMYSSVISYPERWCESVSRIADEINRKVRETNSNV